MRIIYILTILSAFLLGSFGGCTSDEEQIPTPNLNLTGNLLSDAGDEDDGGKGDDDDTADDDDDNDSGPKTDMDSKIILDKNGFVPPLVCPGAKGCEKAEGDFIVGVAKRAISPVIEPWEDLNGNGKWNEGEPFEDLNKNGKWDGVWLAGFGQGRAATDKHDDNWSRVITFEQGDVSFAIVTLDLIGIFHPDVIKVRLAAEKAGLDFDHILVAATHQHEGKDTIGMWGEEFSITGYEPDYIDFIVEETVAALKEAKEGQRKARMEVGLGEASDYVGDTRIPIVLDQNVYSVNFIDESEKVFATWVTWGNHPEALGSDNTLLTSDFAHFTREMLEEHYPGTTAVFFSGILGGLTTPLNLTPCADEEGNPTCPNHSFEKAAWVGHGAAQAAIDVLDASDVTRDDNPTIGFRRLPFMIPIENITFALMAQMGVFIRPVYDEYGDEYSDRDIRQMPPKEFASGIVFLDTEINILSIGILEVATIPGELYAELWLVKEDGTSYIEHPENADFPDAPAETPIQAVMPDDKIKVIFNTSNDFLGYMIPKPQWDNLKPYAYKEKGQYGELNSLGPNTAPIVTEKFKEIYKLKP